MNYPKLKCEDKKNTIVCSLDIKKMKEMRKEGFTYSKIGVTLGISAGTVQYHINPTQNTKEYLEKKRKRNSEYNKRRYATDPEFRQKMKDSTNKYHKERWNNDPKFRKWYQQTTRKNYSIWVKKQQKKHPSWSFTCAKGLHETITYMWKCKNKFGKCRCPCHK